MQDFTALAPLSALRRLEMFHDCPSHLDNLDPVPNAIAGLDPDDEKEVRKCVLGGGGPKGQGSSHVDNLGPVQNAVDVIAQLSHGE